VHVRGRGLRGAGPIETPDSPKANALVRLYHSRTSLQALGVLFVQHDHMVETPAAEGADQPLREGVHQRRSHCGADLADAKTFTHAVKASRKRCCGRGLQ
jgi:hypothetical protein